MCARWVIGEHPTWDLHGLNEMENRPYRISVSLDTLVSISQADVGETSSVTITRLPAPTFSLPLINVSD
jgi:hypothetical protein